MAECAVRKVGTHYRHTAAFHPLGGPPDDPTTVTLTILAPDGTTSTVNGAAMTHDPGTGIYDFDHTPDQPGRWWFSWEGSSPPNFGAVYEYEVQVESRVVVV